ncbi:hypothetical protein [Actinomyces vulturis]|uniref:hypothetical protein n=1 Tax=Actinomyces vulturis TaxID=1857645 RepID=UPI0011472B18|nr:hypothetical protein [Actinomyces vulturis]
MSATVVLALVVGAFYIGEKAGFVTFTTNSQATDTQIIDAVRTENQVVLASLGIQGIRSQESSGQFFGFEIPGSKKTHFLQYSYRAKLGFEGKDVQIEQVDPKHVRIHVPDFIFIGHSDEKFQTIAEDNGILSFATPDIDAAEVVTAVLSSGEMQMQIDNNRQMLEDQAKDYYKSIIHAVDPDMNVEITFSSQH